MTHKKNKGAGMAKATIAGAVVGAGMAIGAVVLSNKKSREKIKAGIADFKGRVGDKKNELREKIAEGEEKVNKVVGEIERK